MHSFLPLFCCFLSCLCNVIERLIENWNWKYNEKVVFKYLGQGSDYSLYYLGKNGGPKNFLYSCAEPGETHVLPTNTKWKGLDDVFWELTVRYDIIKTAENEPWRCDEAKVYELHFWGFRSKEGFRLDLTQQTRMLEIRKKTWKKNSRSVSAYFFSLGYVSSLCLANAVVSVSVLSFFLPATTYKW